MSRRSWLLLTLLAAGCARVSAPPPGPHVERGGWPSAVVPGSAGERAVEWLEQQPASALALTASVADTSSVALLDLFDVELAEERAAEAEVLDALEAARSSTVVRPILAVTGTVTYDIPMASNEMVEQWLSYFMGRGRHWYEIWLSRSTRYVPVFRAILREYGLPEDLIFLAMIESGFSPKAYSWAHAAGPWQFVPFTGKHYGLEIGYWLDQRSDFVHATHAAAKYLRKLHTQFGDWYLAWAGYNAGEYRVESALRRSGQRDFWKIARTRHLKRETKHYVPKLLAAAMIAKQPERYGFGGVVYQPPLAWETVTVTVATDLRTVARACGREALEEDLKGLNPALRRSITPPGRSYELRVPVRTSSACQEGLGRMPPGERWTYRYHSVARGDTAQSIAKRYQTSAEKLLEFNQLDPKRLTSARELIVPEQLAMESVVPVTKAPELTRGGMYVPEGVGMIVHRVQPGDSLWRIAQRYRVSVKMLKLWNGLWSSSRLQIGQAIRVYLGGGGAPSRRAR